MSIRLLHISDIHWEPAPERWIPGLQQRLAAVADAIKALAPDLLVVTGDLTSFGSSAADHLWAARAWLDGLGIPYLAVAGNHDLGANLERGRRFPDSEAYDPAPFAHTNFGRVFGPEPLWERDLGSARLVGFSIRASDPDGVLGRLEAMLNASHRPTILCGHYPLLRVRESGPLGNPEAAMGTFIPDLIEPLTNLVERQPAVRCYVAGHVHVASLRRFRGGAYQLTAGGLGPGASVLRVITIDEVGIRHACVLAPGPLDFWARTEPAWGPYTVEYHLGGIEERAGFIPWRPER